MKKHLLIFLGLGLTFDALLVCLVIFAPKDPPKEKANPPAARPSQHRLIEDRKSTNESSNPDDLTSAVTLAHRTQITALIRQALTDFRAAKPGSTEAAMLLRKLREALRAAPDEQATAEAIIAFLKTGEDAATGLPFQVGTEGSLASAPSLRLVLLDVLPGLDPSASLEMARQIMDQLTNADEYALSLRNLAWNDLEGDLRSELTTRFDTLIKSPWREQPSAGFLEAFDIAVEIGGLPMIDQLSTLAENEATAQAAIIALDRIVLRDPSALVEAANQPGWMAATPLQRASLLSRLDLSAPDQRALFLRYLAAPNHGEGELDYFSKIFPNRNYLSGQRLVTTPETTPNIAEVSAADARALAALGEINATGPASEVIAKIRERLQRFVK